MPLLGLIKEKCAYCKQRIGKDSEVWRNVKIYGYVGTFRKPFCSEEHADLFEKETREMQRNKKGGGGCCG